MHKSGQFAHPVVLLAGADVDYLVVNIRAGASSSAKKARPMSSTWTSGCHGVPSLRMRQDFAGGKRPRGQIVEHQVGPEAALPAIGRGVAQEDRAEILIGQLGDIFLGAHLGDGVGGQGMDG